MHAGRDRTLLRACATFGPMALGSLLGLLRDDVGAAPAALVLVLAVVAVSAAGDRLSGVLAALSAALGYDVFLTVPYYSLAIAGRQDVELVTALVLVGLAVSEIALRGRRAQATSARREGYLSGVAALLDLPADSSRAERGEALARAVGEVVGADRSVWLAGLPDPRDAVVREDGELVLDGCVLDPVRDGLPTDRVTAVPAVHEGEVVGHVAIVAATRVLRPSHEQLRVVALLVRVGGRVAPGPDARR